MNATSAEVVAAIITGLMGFIAVLLSVVAGFLTSWLTTRRTLQRLKLELRGRQRGELAKRQLDACETVWALFGSTSLTEGESRIIRQAHTDSPELDIRETELWIDSFQKAFSSKAGLYLSRRTRRRLHAFRDQLIALRTQATATGSVALTRAQVLDLRKLRTEARLALRDQIGSTDLQVAKSEFHGDDFPE